MSILRRMAIVVKSLLNVTADRVDRIAVEEELRAAKARKEAEEEIKTTLGPDRPGPTSARSGGLLPEASSYIPTRAVSDSAKLAADYKLLGIKPGADLQAVEAAWRELMRRADPKRFPSGSEEEKKAARILTSVNEAYARIREAINPTEGRFGRLEL